MGLLLICWPPN